MYLHPNGFAGPQQRQIESILQNLAHGVLKPIQQVNSTEKIHCVIHLGI